MSEYCSFIKYIGLQSCKCLTIYSISILHRRLIDIILRLAPRGVLHQSGKEVMVRCRMYRLLILTIIYEYYLIECVDPKDE